PPDPLPFGLCCLRIRSLRLLLRSPCHVAPGTGDAGKSTFAKQMKVIHKDGFTKQEIERFTDILRDNCLVAMQKLLQACQNWDYKIEEKSKADAVLAATALTVPLPLLPSPPGAALGS